MLLLSALEKTLFEMKYNEKPNLSFGKLFGCVAFLHIEKQLRKKLDQTSKKGIFLGNSDNSKCYKIGFEDEKRGLKIRNSRNIRFNENEFYFEQKKTQNLVTDIDNDSNEVSFLSQLAIDPLLPKNVDEALQNPNWFEEMKIEYHSLIENKVCSLVKSDEKPVGSRWHFAFK